MKTLMIALLTIFSAFVLEGCIDSVHATDPVSNEYIDNGDTHEDDPISDLPAAFNLFTDNVNIYRDGEYVVLESDGIPNHPSPYFGVGHEMYEAYNGDNTAYRTNPNSIAEQSLVFRIPLFPGQARTHQSTSLGPIGISLNGVPFYNQYAGPNQPLTNEINSFDQYNGHPQRTGQYHYHIEPLYLTATNGKDGLLGFLLDGFPVYGPEENGHMVDESSLDIYHGHSHATAEYPEGIYHYHITGADPYINGGEFYGTPGTVTQ